MEYKRINKVKHLIISVIAIILTVILITDFFLTKRLNEKYISSVSYNNQLYRYCEYNGDEYVMAGTCSIFDWYTDAAVQLFHVYYDENHQNVTVSLIIREYKNGKTEYMFGFDTDEDPEWGGYVNVDANMNPVKKEKELINPISVQIMNSLRPELKRLLNTANSRWNLGLSLTLSNTP